jgi:glycosyltransferase involved in cell wall biosynthesis
MRLLYAVQRYGREVVGGSEAATRLFAERLVEHGHHVEVVTSCARSYVDWADHYAPGTEEIEGVLVHRLPVVDVRRPEVFGPLHEWMVSNPRPAPLFQQALWAKHMGPDLNGYRSWLHTNVHRFDVAVFMTYMYTTASLGLTVASGRVPTVLQPTAHDEPAIWVRLWDTVFRLPDSFLFFTPEEREFVVRRFGIDPPSRTIGIGIELEGTTDVGATRRRLGLGEAPYLVYVGRIDAVKGSTELAQFFATYKERRPGPLKLVLVGEQIDAPVPHGDIIPTGFLSEADKRDVIAGALALVQPSRFESFSIVVCESWVQRRPVLIHSDSPVLVGQIGRSAGGLPYGGFAEFEAAVDRLLDDAFLADRLGNAGRHYVEANYRWADVLRGFDEALDLACDQFARRSGRRDQ